MCPAIAPKLVEEAQRWRHEIHRHPELAFEEFRTAEFISQKLSSFGLKVETGIGKTGVVGFLERGSKTIALRCDMDALPVQEENKLPYKSQVEGKMHACGHDGHTAILLAAAKHLSQIKDLAVNVLFIFQPAEEKESGALAMLADGLLEKYPCEAIFALHNWPGLEVGKVAVKRGAMMASSDVFTINLEGRGTHAAMPHLGDDLVLMASQLILALETLVLRKLTPGEPALISICSLSTSSDAYNVLPQRVTLKGTCRAFSAKTREFLEKEIKRQTLDFARAQQIRAEVSYTRYYPPTINDPEWASYVAQCATELFGKENVLQDFLPSFGAEDFSFFLEKLPGAYFWLGNGSTSPLHSPNYDFNDELLAYGIALWEKIVLNFPKYVRAV
ncbi:MAG: M20 family metallopeptidase [Leptospiraceae bacterium]|nr:M20 family metallopeptidase [Leptospiraceae bacterium]MDW8307071.1 M20 aminoacylase family protein [Leptospiraceae bacterium]